MLEYTINIILDKVFSKRVELFCPAAAAYLTKGRVITTTVFTQKVGCTR